MVVARTHADYLQLVRLAGGSSSGADAGGWDPVLGVGVIDLSAVAAGDTDGALFMVHHEQGHALDGRLDLRALMPSSSGAVRAEQAAQCVAYLTTPGFGDRSWSLAVVGLGYWSCPEPWRSEVRAAMVLAGVGP